MRRIVTLLIVLAGFAALAYPGGMVLGAAAGRDVIILTALKDDATRELELFQLEDEFEDADASDPAYQLAVIETYGSYAPTELVFDRVLFVGDERIIEPAELEGSGIQMVLRTEEAYVWQYKSIANVTGNVSLVGLLAFVGLLVLRSRLGPRADADAGVVAPA